MKLVSKLLFPKEHHDMLQTRAGADKGNYISDSNIQKTSYRNNLKVPNAKNRTAAQAFKAPTLVSFCDLAVFCLSWLRISARRLCTSKRFSMKNLHTNMVVRIKLKNMLLHLAVFNDSETYYIKFIEASSIRLRSSSQEVRAA